MASSMPTSNILRDEFGYEVPVERIPLPSNGLVYPQGHPLHGVDAVDIKAMTAREEDILMSRALQKQGSTISALLQSCISDKRIDPKSLISGDRLAITLGIRITGYGSRYVANIGCQSCQSVSKQEFDIGGLDVKPLTLEPVSGGNLFEFVLPMSGKRVHFHFMTGKEEEDYTAMLERKQKLFPGAPEGSVTSRLETHIDSVDGVTDKSKISKFVASMPAGDARALRNFIDSNEPGVDLGVGWNCPSCNYENKNTLPLGPLFFWTE
jgi:hypothetical protein